MIDEYKDKDEKQASQEKRSIPRTVILDFDRTLMSLYEDASRLRKLAKILCDYYAPFIPVPSAFYDRDGYLAWYDLHRAVKEKYDPKDASEINGKAETLVTAFEDEVVAATSFLPGAIDTVRELFARGFELLIVSNNAGDVIEKALAREGVLNCFKGIVGRTLPFDPDRIKPDPYQLELALKKAAADRRAVCYAGDDYMDVDAARKCGVLSVGVATGRYSAKALKERGADLTVDSVADLCALFG